MCKVGRASATHSEAGAATAPPAPPLIKVALLGDSQVGKTSLMNRFVEGTFDDTELQTQVRHPHSHAWPERLPPAARRRGRPRGHWPGAAPRRVSTSWRSR